ncbi:uncharacterized protein [Physcomitrium patens]|uniref:DUF8003 domain-containing protein n=1 Tax=Physcomitrium patens TaxID=3218 RepID=A0A2K1JTH2_PHYPA|nr:uncharacterized protein LOC112288662 isoform X2 [Physcomitrium patens]PNR44820.1 hypothetical protein PHYPA_014590 [Physcomitrium patens]|eukprot:XP_024388875.1 uncharacterized protein LOC112288662 isoform X2 [Physcomitrella patens]
MAALGFNSTIIGILILFLHVVFYSSCSTSDHAVALWVPTRSLIREPHPGGRPDRRLRQSPGTPLTPDVYHKYAEQSLTCEEDLLGAGSLETVCVLKQSVSFAADETFVVGNGTLEIQPNVSISCIKSGCSLTILLDGDLNMGENSTIRSSSLWIQAANVNIGDAASLDSSEFGGKPPSGASGTPSGIDGAGAGHGGRGAYCVKDHSKEQRDSWGGDMYGWSTLMQPWFYGSSGGTTSNTSDLGGKGGGRVNVTVMGILVINGSIEADGGSVGEEGGGGSGGSLFVRASRIKGNGQISAIGGSGRGGASGGRIAIDSMRLDGVTVRYHGGDSLTCLQNNGASGTRFDIFSATLYVSNSNKTTSTDTLLLEFPNHPLWSKVIVENNASVLVPLLWSRVQVRSMITLQSGGLLSFGLASFSSSVFELVAEEVLMSDSTIKVYGALKLTVKMLLMWNSTIKVDGNPDDFMLATSTVETSNLVILREGSVIESSANLGMHGQGLLKLSGPGDMLRAQRLFVSLFYTVHVAKGALMQAPLEEDSPIKEEISKIYCENNICPEEVLMPSEDCTLNVSSPFTMQICRVEDVHINGTVLGSAVHVQRVKTISIRGLFSSSSLGCEGGLGRGMIGSAGAAGGGGHGGRGGKGYYKGHSADGGAIYGNHKLPCEFGSGSGNASFGDSTTGGGIIVMGSSEHPISKIEIFGALSADGGSFNASQGHARGSGMGDPGGGSGGSLLLFLQTLVMGNESILSSAGGHGGPVGGGGGGGGRLHFHWSNIPTGIDFVPIAYVKGVYHTRGGHAGEDVIHPEGDKSEKGEDGTISGIDCPPGLYGIFCEECPVGTFKNETGWKPELCKPCPPENLPRRANYTYARGGVVETACPYQCISDKYHMPNCYTMVEDLIYTLGGPWLFTLLLSVVMVVLAMVLSVARMKLVGNDDFTGPAPTPHGGHIDHSFPFLESLNEVLETTRVEESQNHIHRMYFMGNNTFNEPWHLPHSPPEQIMDLVYEDAFNRFAEEINCLAAYQWWEGSVHSILSVLAYPVAWSWQQWRARKKFQRLREYVRSEYDHACLRSCRSRALYEGLKVAATPDLMLAYIDVFLGGDEKRPDLPPKLMQRLPMTIIFGGEGSYLAPYSLHSDNLLTSLVGQAVPSTMWYRMVAGLNAQLRTVRRGSLRSSLLPVMNWLSTHANPRLSTVGVRVDMAWYQATATGYYQLGLVMNPADDAPQSLQFPDELSPSSFSRRNYIPSDQDGRFNAPQQWQFSHGYSQLGFSRRRTSGAVIDPTNLRSLEEKRYLFFPISLLLRNARPVGHHASVGLVISLLLLVDLSLTLLMLLQFYSISLGAMLGILLVLPFASVLPSAAGLNALFSHGPRKSAALARIYALWNITSFVNLLTAFIYGYIHYVMKFGAAGSDLQGLNSEEESWWLFPALLVLEKSVQARMIDLHIANLEIQDRSLYSEDASRFWES